MTSEQDVKFERHRNEETHPRLAENLRCAPLVDPGDGGRIVHMKMDDFATEETSVGKNGTNSGDKFETVNVRLLPGPIKQFLVQRPFVLTETDIWDKITSADLTRGVGIDVNRFTIT
jgi:hypothetical protein